MSIAISGQLRGRPLICDIYSLHCPPKSEKTYFMMFMCEEQLGEANFMGVPIMESS